MTTAWNIYCDESCHSELTPNGEAQRYMVLGAVTCPTSKAREIAVRIREIKDRHGINPATELKWTKVSPNKLPVYRAVIDYFFDDADLSFRAIVLDKTQLDHKAYFQTHEEFYWKMYFELLTKLLAPDDEFFIYLDIKDTRGGKKSRKLHRVLADDHYDFQRQIVRRIQIVRSDEIEQMQIADLLIGAVGYANHKRSTSTAKLHLVSRIRQRSRYLLTKTTLLSEQKMNVLVWRPTMLPAKEDLTAPEKGHGNGGG